MKATIDIPDDLYRQIKAKSALEGRSVRDVSIEIFEQWVKGNVVREESESYSSSQKMKVPSWFGALRKYSTNAHGRHDMDSVRKSIVRGRVKEESK